MTLAPSPAPAPSPSSTSTMKAGLQEPARWSRPRLVLALVATVPLTAVTAWTAYVVAATAGAASAGLAGYAGWIAAGVGALTAGLAVATTRAQLRRGVDGWTDDEARPGSGATDWADLMLAAVWMSLSVAAALNGHHFGLAALCAVGTLPLQLALTWRPELTAYRLSIARWTPWGAAAHAEAATWAAAGAHATEVLRDPALDGAGADELVARLIGDYARAGALAVADAPTVWDPTTAGWACSTCGTSVEDAPCEDHQPASYLEGHSYLGGR